MTLYDSTGRAVAYIEDNGGIYLYSGEPVAYLHDDLVYSYDGTHLGRFEDGWVRDTRGYCVFFTEDASDNGPVKPVRHVKPIKSLKQLRPLKSIRHIPSLKPIDSLAWSNDSGESFFMQ